MNSRALGVVLVIATTMISSFFASALAEPAPTSSAHVDATPMGQPPTKPIAAVLARARLEVSRRVIYDPAWFSITYPSGDPPPERGVCTDLVIRSVRAMDIDLQREIHEDILRRRSAYPMIKVVDRTIDHRRVGPMLVWLRAHATSLPKTFDSPSAWRPGDIVVWAFKPCPACSPDHVGIVGDRAGPRGIPLVLHNIGPRPTEDDSLDAWTVLGHFRLEKEL